MEIITLPTPLSKEQLEKLSKGEAIELVPAPGKGFCLAPVIVDGVIAFTPIPVN